MVNATPALAMLTCNDHSDIHSKIISITYSDKNKIQQQWLKKIEC